MAASALFMSAAPRPKSRPSRTVGLNGSLFHSSSGPVGTTSVWPAKHSTGPPLPRVAQKLSTLPISKVFDLETGCGEPPGHDFLATLVGGGDGVARKEIEREIDSG